MLYKKYLNHKPLKIPKMDNDKINVHVPADYNGTPIKLVILEGDAPKELDAKDTKKQYTQAVTIDAIAEWTGKRKFETDITANKAVIEFSTKPDNPHIDFYEDPTNTEATKLTSKLKKNPDIAAWNINNGTSFNPKKLREHILKYGGMFPDSATAKALISTLQNYQVKVSTEIEKEDNRQGATKDSKNQLLQFVRGEAPKAVQLKAPLFENTEPVDLTLEIEIDVINSEPCYSFYCFELSQLYIDKAKEYIEVVVNPLKEKFVCLEK